MRMGSFFFVHFDCSKKGRREKWKSFPPLYSNVFSSCACFYLKKKEKVPRTIGKRKMADARTQNDDNGWEK